MYVKNTIIVQPLFLSLSTSFFTKTFQITICQQTNKKSSNLPVGPPKTDYHLLLTDTRTMIGNRTPMTSVKRKKNRKENPLTKTHTKLFLQTKKKLKRTHYPKTHKLKKKASVLHPGVIIIIEIIIIQWRPAGTPRDGPRSAPSDRSRRPAAPTRSTAE